MKMQRNARQMPEFTLGDYLTKSREWAGLSQQEMADRLLVSRTSVVNWENDHTYPTPRRLTAWAMATGVTVDWLKQGVVVRSHARTGWSAGEQAQPSSNRSRRTPGWGPRERDIPAPAGHWPRHYVYGLHQRAESFQLVS